MMFGMTTDSRMAKVIADSGAVVCIMHMNGTPQSMQDNPNYKNGVHTIADELSSRIETALKYGIKKIIIDPGIGFGKTLAHNLAILNHLDMFVAMGYPVLLGTSRKSFINAISPCEVSDRLPGSLASIVLARQQGVQFFRVHDVAETVQALRVTDAIFTGVQND